MICALAQTRPAAAQLPPPPGDADELAGWNAVAERKFVRAREVGEALVKKAPASYAAHYILGAALHYGDGELARAVAHLQESARLFEAIHPGPTSDQRWRWHEATLRELATVLDEMERPADELAVLARYDARYLPKRTAERVWPLMKLRRFDDARRVGQEVVGDRTTHWFERLVARTALCATECEAGDRAAAHRECQAGTAEFTFRVGVADALFSNAAIAARGVFAFDEAERLLVEATRRVVPHSWANPWHGLGLLYLGQGRLGEAIAAFKGGHELRLRRPAWMDQHHQARIDGSLAILFLVVGETDRAVALAKQAELRPDRQGVHSGTEAQAAAGVAILVATALREQAARDEERAATSTFFAAARLRAAALLKRIEAWQEERKAGVALADVALLTRSLRPHSTGGVDLANWLRGSVARTVGSGVFLNALGAVRPVETYGPAPAYLDAWAAEAEWLRGDEDAAVRLGEAALARLPSSERLLRARVSAIVAGALYARGGDARRADQRIAFALATDPGVLRRLDIALPVRIERAGASLRATEYAALMARRSPRFTADVAARHAIRIDIDLMNASACLLGPDRSTLQCSKMPRGIGVGDEAVARVLMADFHKVAFAPRLELAKDDITSLDGSPAADRAERQVRSLLDTIGQKR